MSHPVKDRYRYARSFEQFRRITAYLKERAARPENVKRREIMLAWAYHRGDVSGIVKGGGRASDQLERKWMEQRGVCFYCGAQTWLTISVTREDRMSRHRRQQRATREHLVRRADGGSDDDSNIVMACDGCNSSRGETSVEEWLRVKSSHDAA